MTHREPIETIGDFDCAAAMLLARLQDQTPPPEVRRTTRRPFVELREHLQREHFMRHYLERHAALFRGGGRLFCAVVW